MYGFSYHFNNLRFNITQDINDCSAAHVVVAFVSSGILKCRFLKRWLDHPMKCTIAEETIKQPPRRFLIPPSSAMRTKSGLLRLHREALNTTGVCASLIHSVIYPCITHSLARSLTHSLPRSLTRSLTHSCHASHIKHHDVSCIMSILSLCIYIGAYLN